MEPQFFAENRHARRAKIAWERGAKYRKRMWAKKDNFEFQKRVKLAMIRKRHEACHARAVARAEQRKLLSVPF